MNTEHTKRILHLPVKGEYFHQMKDGSKSHEYRLRNEHWQKRLVNREYDEVHIKLGYPKREDTSWILVKPWLGYVEETICHPHFGEEPVDVFAIVINPDTNLSN